MIDILTGLHHHIYSMYANTKLAQGQKQLDKPPVAGMMSQIDEGELQIWAAVSSPQPRAVNKYKLNVSGTVLTTTWTNKQREVQNQRRSTSQIHGQLWNIMATKL